MVRAGVRRANLRPTNYWGFQDGDQGHASYVVVEDMPVVAAAAVVVEVRDGVGIDRESGAAAEGIKYDRAILPRGTKLAFALERRESKDLGSDRLAGAWRCLLR